MQERENGKLFEAKEDINILVLLGYVIIGLFTVAILEPFSAHFQSHFWLIFVYLAEEQTKRD